MATHRRFLDFILLTEEEARTAWQHADGITDLVIPVGLFVERDEGFFQQQATTLTRCTNVQSIVFVYEGWLPACFVLDMIVGYYLRIPALRPCPRIAVITIEQYRKNRPKSDERGCGAAARAFIQKPFVRNNLEPVDPRPFSSGPLGVQSLIWSLRDFSGVDHTFLPFLRQLVVFYDDSRTRNLAAMNAELVMSWNIPYVAFRGNVAPSVQDLVLTGNRHDKDIVPRVLIGDSLEYQRTRTDVLAKELDTKESKTIEGVYFSDATPLMDCLVTQFPYLPTFTSDGRFPTHAFIKRGVSRERNLPFSAMAFFVLAAIRANDKHPLRHSLAQPNLTSLVYQMAFPETLGDDLPQLHISVPDEWAKRYECYAPFAAVCKDQLHKVPSTKFGISVINEESDEVMRQVKHRNLKRRLPF